MQKEPLKTEYACRLAGYDIANIDLRDTVLLRFQPGEAIMSEGMPMEYLMFVISGKAKVCSTTASGKDLILCYYISEGIIGDMELMTGALVGCKTMCALTEFLCIGLPYKKYAEILKADLIFVNRVGRELSQKLILSSRHNTDIALHSGEERLCAYILQTTHDSLFCETLTDVARSIGVSYRHLLRMLNRLCAEDVLRKESHGYRILNRPELIRRTSDFDM